MNKALGIAAAIFSIFVIHMVWWVGLIVGFGVWIAMTSKNTGTKLIQVIDLETGSVTTQPVDRAAEKYLATRNDNN